MLSSEVMTLYDWDPEKNLQLIEERGMSFEEVIFHLQSDGLLDDVEHPNQTDYPHQRMFVVLIEDYVYLVPYVESEKGFFLKTIIPSRKATRQYLRESNE